MNNSNRYSVEVTTQSTRRTRHADLESAISSARESVAALQNTGSVTVWDSLDKKVVAEYGTVRSTVNPYPISLEA